MVPGAIGRGLLLALACVACTTARDSGPAAPRDDELARQRREMVETQLRERGIGDARVLEAMRRVPRHRFVREQDLAIAYGDHPIPIGLGQTISQPYIVAFMTEALAIEPGHKVLEVGTGSGYQAAILASSRARSTPSRSCPRLLNAASGSSPSWATRMCTCGRVMATTVGPNRRRSTP